MKRFLVGLAILSLALSVSPASADNLLTNPGFEASGGSFDGWTPFGNFEISNPGGDDIYRTGTAAAKFYGAFSGGFNVSGFFQAFTPVSGATYRLSGWAYVSSGDSLLGTDTCQGNRAIAQIAFFDAASGGTVILRNEVVIGDGNTPVDTWVPFDVELPVPAGALRVEALFLFLQPGLDPGAVFVDDTMFQELSTPSLPNILANPQFSGGLTGWTTFDNVFYEAGDNPGLDDAGLIRSLQGSAKLFSSGLGTPSGMFQKFAAAPGSSWRLDAYAMTSCAEGDQINLNNTNSLVAVIEFRNAAGDSLRADGITLRDASSPLGRWTEHTLISADAPAGTDSVFVFFLFESPDFFPGAAWVDDVSFSEVATTGTPTRGRNLGLTLFQNAPNPFRSSTRIAFDLEVPMTVRLSVYDVAGRRVATLSEGILPEGPHAVAWDGRSDRGSRVAAGSYWYVLETDTGRVAKGLLLLD